MGLSLFTKLMTTSFGMKSSGYNYEYQMDGVSDNKLENAVVEPKVSHVNLSDKSAYHTIYVLNDNSVWVGGANRHGQLGDGTTTDKQLFRLNLPDAVKNKRIKKVVCGGYHTMILFNDGTVYGCGFNQYGQLGIYNSNNVTTFTEISTLTESITDIWCGGYHTIFKGKSGKVYSCGKNHHGQTGLGLGITEQLTPTEIISLRDNLNFASCGGDFTYFLTKDKKVYVCGYNGYGQLGINSTDNNQHTLTEITSSIDSVKKGNLVQIACGANHAIFLTDTRLVYGVGDNGYGQLGLGTQKDVSNVVVQLDVQNIRNIVTDAYTSIFQINTKKLKGCGHNKFGELGLGDNENRYEIVDLLYTDIYLDDLRDEIITIPDFDVDKNLYVIDGYWMTTIGSNFIYMDNEMNIVVRNANDMAFRYVRYFYLDDENIKFSSVYEDVFDSKTNERKHFFEGFKTVCSSTDDNDDLLLFSVNQHLYELNCVSGELTEVYEFTDNLFINWIYNKWCGASRYSIEKDIYTQKYYNRTNGFISSVLNIGCFSIITPVDQSSDYKADTDSNGNKIFDFIGVTKYRDRFEISKIKTSSKNITLVESYSTDTVSSLGDISAIYYNRGRVYLGTREGRVYINYIEEDKIFHYIETLESEIVSMQIYYYSSVLDKSLLLDEQGKNLLVFTSDGRYVKLPLYKTPTVELSVKDTFLVGDDIYHNFTFQLKEIDKLNTYDNYYYNMRFLIHNRYNEEELELTDLFTGDGYFSGMIKFNNLSLDIYNYFWLGYIYGNNCRGIVGVKTYNVKMNLIFNYLNRISYNISNYTSIDAYLILEKVNSDGSVTEVETHDIPSGSDHTFGRFNEHSDIETFNLKVSNGEGFYYLYEEEPISNITFNDTVAYYTNEYDIQNNFTKLYNHIYETKSLDDISTKYIVDILSLLSNKSHEMISPLSEVTQVESENVVDTYGNDLAFLMNNSVNYIQPINPSKIYKDNRYRMNLFINGRKIPYKEVYPIFDMKNGAINVYFRKDSFPDTTNNVNEESPVIDFNLYNEDLMSEEKELYTIYIAKSRDTNKLLAGEYKFTVKENFSKYLDLDYISIFIKFRQGTFWNRIELSDYELKIEEISNTFTTFSLKINNEILTKIGNEVHIMLNDLDKKESYMFKHTEMNKATYYENYFIPLLEITEQGNLVNHYTEKSENIEVFVDGNIMIPYIDYKVVNFPLHLQFPSMVLFLHPIKTNIKLEINISKNNYINGIVTTKKPWSSDKNSVHTGQIIEEKNKNDLYYYSSLEECYIPMLNSLVDLFVDGAKVPLHNKKDSISTEYMSLNKERHTSYLKFYIKDEPFVRFLCTLLRLKSHQNGFNPSDYDNLEVQGTVNSFKPSKTKSEVYNNDSKTGLLYLLFEQFDTSLAKNKDVIIDCADRNQFKFYTNVRLDTNEDFTLPYIKIDLELDCNVDYNKNSYNNLIS